MLVCPVYQDIVKSLVGFRDSMEEDSEGSSSKLAEYSEDKPEPMIMLYLNCSLLYRLYCIF